MFALLNLHLTDSQHLKSKFYNVINKNQCLIYTQSTRSTRLQGWCSMSEHLPSDNIKQNKPSKRKKKTDSKKDLITPSSSGCLKQLQTIWREWLICFWQSLVSLKFLHSPPSSEEVNQKNPLGTLQRQRGKYPVFLHLLSCRDSRALLALVETDGPLAK